VDPAQFLIIVFMFVLHPDGPSGGGGGAPGSSGSDFGQKIWFFGKLGIYFGLLHALSWYVNSSGVEAKAIERSSQ
jgi:hypothetical protein